MKIKIPPLKIQGIKSKLVCSIKSTMKWDNQGIYLEPFMSSGVVGFNIAPNGDFIYCDPPYIDRHCDYFNAWNETKEKELYEILSSTKAKFILSTWHSNRYRENKYIITLWNRFYNDIIEHFYHLGASENNRNAIKEALIKNYVVDTNFIPSNPARQKSLFG
ncbi:DNA adenine methylase [Helicobacter sp. UBA3407]|uniref:DNA adenine methylase n=1 Tax=Helicobacter TaxID=209 RepID=UPI00260C3D58|nr:DNA adenine methylase [Helicobacter sp. UBA3407]